MNFTVKFEEILPYIENFEPIFNHFTEDDVDNFICQISNNLPYWDYETGASKLVIIPGDKDFVIKIPFDGHYTDCTDEEDECYTFHPFNLYKGGWQGNDHCAIEERISLRAEGSPFEDFILPVCLHKEASDYAMWPIYIQPKAITFIDTEYQDDEGLSPSRESTKSVNRMKSDGVLYSRLPTDWLALCLDILENEETLKELIDFFEEIGANQDLHNANIGYYEGQPVLIDYAGYWE